MGTHCSLRTFWIGFRDWLHEKAEKPLAEEFREAAEESYGFAKPFLVFFVCLAVLMLVGCALQLADRHSLFTGASPKTWALVSTIVAETAIPLLILYWLYGRYRRIRRFCAEMCLRGQRIEAMRQNAS